ncbi:uncharacterized protein LOC110657649 [Hevea brasiliensis]|nr:uncharacterized protein LOC110657649 [Hevea brasiliensis]
MDILDECEFQTQDSGRKLRKILSRAGATRASAIPCTATLSDTLTKKMSTLEKWALSRYREKASMSDENRNAVLGVAVLTATATYQAVLSPPGGVWQGDPSLLPSKFDDTNTGDANNGAIHLMGSPVMFYLFPLVWSLFSALNTTTFFFSIEIIYSLLPRRPLIVLPLVIRLFLCYGISWYVVQSNGIILYSSVVAVAAMSMCLWGLVKQFQKAWSGLAHLIADNPKIERQKS